MNTSELSDKFQDWQARARTRAKDLGLTADTYVRQNTWSTLALVALLGCVLGYLLTARRD